jgi:hypothetical protein
VVADEIERAVLDAAGDTAVGRVDDQLRITRHLALPTPGELYDAVHELAKVAVSLARSMGGGAGSPTFESLSTPDEAEEPEVPAEVAAPAPAPSPEATVAHPVVAEPLYWFYVDAPQTIVSGDENRTPLSTLQPGVWYQALEEAGEWVRAADDRGVEGWIGANVVRRQ